MCSKIRQMHFSVFALIARFSKCVFGIFGKFRIDIEKKFFEKTFFSRWKIFSKKKSEKKIVIFLENQNCNFFFEILFIDFFNGENFEKKLKFWFFPKKAPFFFDFFRENFSSRKKSFFKKSFFYVDPKFSKDSKNRT